MKSKNWKDRQKKDIYVKNAKKEGYFSRSAFKLIEIDNKFKILKSSNKIISKACPLFVPIIEEGLSCGKIVKEIIHYYLSDIKNTDISVSKVPPVPNGKKIKNVEVTVRIATEN